MTHLKFRRGCSDSGSSDFNVDFHFDYGADLKKKVKAVTFYKLGCQQKLSIPWIIFSYYAQSKPTRPFVSGTGLRMWFEGDKLVINQARFFDIEIHVKQLDSIIRCASTNEGTFSRTVDDVLSSYVSQ